MDMDIRQDIKERFDAEGFKIHFPHRSLYTGSVTEPFPIRIAQCNSSTTLHLVKLQLDNKQQKAENHAD